MEDGELDVSTHEMFQSPNMADIPSTDSLDSFFNDIFKDTHACTHTHTCNPPGPTDSSHTHTCYHVHTKLLPAITDEDDKTDTAESSEKKGKKRPLGNREAVRKYREKKKARAASLEDEVVRLRALNQQLLKRVQSQAGLEGEVARLKCLLVDIRGRIEGEIGSFPYQNKSINNGNNNVNLGSGGYVMNPCNMECGDQVYCLHSDKIGEGGLVNDSLGCEFESLQCLGNQGNLVNGVTGCENEGGFVVGNSTGGRSKRKGARSGTSK